MHWLVLPEFAALPAWVWAACAGAFFLGGLVKGTLGVGLPLVAVPLLSLMLPTPTAIALVAVPVLASNTWQAWDTRAQRSSMRRFMPLLVALALCSAVTVPMTLALSGASLNAMMALAVVTAVVLMALNPQVHIPPQREGIAGALVGAVSGAMGGVSSLTGPVIITYLMALKLRREDFIGSISVIYVAGCVPLYLAMVLVGRLQWQHAALSLVAMLPMAAGLAGGKWLRGRISEVAFRRVLLGFLLVIAAVLVAK